MNLQIERDLPIPAPHTVKYGFLDPLAIGESIHITDPVNKASLKACVSYRQIRYNKKFSLQVQPDGSIRIWRIA